MSAPPFGGWKELRSPDGEVYYQNSITGKTTWDKPEELKGIDENDSGDWAWMPHPEDGYVACQVLKREDTQVTVKTEDSQQYTLRGPEAKKLVPMNRAALRKDVDDLVQMDRIDEGMIVHNLKQRYAKGEIYTNVGTILIAVNPFKQLPLYTARHIENYRNRGGRILSPHIYEIANAAFSEMSDLGQNQSVLISGESGAGKTEATKQVLSFLATVAGSENGVEQKVLQANPILESFGNAKTLRNNNSSRFGKWMEIFFDQRRKICGSQVQNYLLEKSRVTFQIYGERNYHIFYMACKGFDDEQRAKYEIGAPEEYAYCTRGECCDIPGVDDQHEFRDMLAAMKIIGFSADEKDNVFTVVSAVLHLGNLVFDPDGKGVVNRERLQIIGRLLRVSPELLEAALSNKTMRVKGHQDMIIPLDARQASDNRDALAKAMYGNLFDWIVQRVNQSMALDDPRKRQLLIGVLDIFGFEIFEKNSFEQLCINYCNEKLQQHFNQHTFKLEEQLYQDEGIRYEHVVFIDNQIVLDLIESKPKGIIPTLDEEIVLPKGSDKSFLQKLHNTYDKRHERYRKPLRPPDSFVINHYAGEVTYDVTGFLDKNKDTLLDDLYKMISNCGLAFLRDLFKEGQGKGKQSLGFQFKNQLNDLMTTLTRTVPHYVRCVKPNSDKVANKFCGMMSLNQLRYAGVFEAVRIRQTGFPFRWTHAEWVNRYRLLNRFLTGTDHRDHIEKLVANMKCDMTELQIGRSRVLYRAKTHRTLELERNVALNERSIIIQRYFRRYRAQILFEKMRRYHKALFAAICERNLDMLTAALELSADLRFEMKSLTDARALRKLIIEENRCTAELTRLRDLDPESNFEAMMRVLNACAVINFDTELVQYVQARVHDAKMRREATAELKEAIAEVNLVGLIAGLTKGREYSLKDPVVRQAEQLQRRLEEELRIITNLQDAMAQGCLRGRNYDTIDATTLQKCIDRAVKFELLTPPGKAALTQAQMVARIRVALKADDWEDVEKALQDSTSLPFSGLPLEEIKQARAEFALKCAKDKVVETLVAAIKDFNDAVLRAELERATALGMMEERPKYGDVIDEAQRLLELVSRARTLIGQGFRAVDDTLLGKGVQLAESFGYETHEVNRAREMRDTIAHYKAYCKVALLSLERPELEECLAGCERIQLHSADVQSIRDVLALPLDRFYMAQLSVAERDNDISRIIKVSIQHKDYFFSTRDTTKFAVEYFEGMRPLDEYAQGTIMNRQRNRESMFQWIAKDLPNSMTRLDPELAKIAKRLFKNIQGFMRDVRCDYPMALAQELIDTAREWLPLRNEVYAQVIKQITNNQSKERDSEALGWDLMQLLVQAFPASDKFSSYIEYFLRAHGKSTANATKEDLLKWYHESIFTGGRVAAGIMVCEQVLKQKRKPDVFKPLSPFYGAKVQLYAKGEAPRPPDPQPVDPVDGSLGQKGPLRKFVRALFSYSGECDDELPLEPGDVIEVLNDAAHTGWWEGRSVSGGARRKGMFPYNFVEVLRNYVPEVVAAPDGPPPLPEPHTEAAREIRMVPSEPVMAPGPTRNGLASPLTSRVGLMSRDSPPLPPAPAHLIASLRPDTPVNVPSSGLPAPVNVEVPDPNAPPPPAPGFGFPPPLLSELIRALPTPAPDMMNSSSAGLPPPPGALPPPPAGLMTSLSPAWTPTQPPPGSSGSPSTALPSPPPVALPPPPPPQTTKPLFPKMRALYEHAATRGDLLSFRPGDVISVVKPDDGSGWAMGICRGMEGLFPLAYCTSSA